MAINLNPCLQIPKLPLERQYTTDELAQVSEFRIYFVHPTFEHAQRFQPTAEIVRLAHRLYQLEMQRRSTSKL